MYLIIWQDTVYHEGDERSRTNPGHGYPAYTENVDKVKFCGNIPAVEAYIKSLNDMPYKVYEAAELNVEKSVKFTFNPK